MSESAYDGVFTWMKQKYPEMANMDTKTMIAFLRGKGLLGQETNMAMSGMNHNGFGVGDAVQMGLSQAQAPNLMERPQGLPGLMAMANRAGSPQAPRQQAFGLMAPMELDNDPWGLMRG